jgi:PAS domain S-box-containing protein
MVGSVVANILYVEDEAPLRELLDFSLSSVGYTVDVAADGTSGIEKFEQQKYDLVVVDYMLPDMTGIDIARHIIQQQPDMPVLMVTGAGSEEVAVEALTHGISDYVIKGSQAVYLETIPRAISKLLESARLKREKEAAEQALKMSEARYRTLLESMPVSVLELDLSGRILSANASGLAIIGPDLVANPSSRGVVGILDTEDQDRIARLLSLAAGGNAQIFEFSIQPDDEIHHYAGGFQPVVSDSGNVEKLICTFQDISPIKRLETQLLQSQKMEAVGQLTGGIAHDFNNLLAIIQSNIDVLELKVGEDEFCVERLRAIEKTVDRGSAMTTRLLAYSRKQALISEPTSLNKLVAGLEDMLARSLTENVNLEILPGDGECQAMFDPNQFENALLNLSINARDAMPDGGKLIIDISEFEMDDSFVDQNAGAVSGKYVLVSVVDHGRGMSPETLSHAFEPFFTTKDVDEGTGLGLSMVYGFAKQSDGYVVIDSVEGRGTTVNLFLPAHLGEMAPTGVVETRVMPVKGTGLILAVEDNPDLRDVMMTSLQENGYKVVEAQDGEHAIDILRGDQSFDLLFTDVVMPGGINGVDLAEQARVLQPHIRVLFTSGYTDTAVALQGKLKAGDTLLKKPYKRVELLDMVDQALSDDQAGEQT